MRRRSANSAAAAQRQHHERHVPSRTRSRGGVSGAPGLKRRDSAATQPSTASSTGSGRAGTLAQRGEHGARRGTELAPGAELVHHARRLPRRRQAPQPAEHRAATPRAGRPRPRPPAARSRPAPAGSRAYRARERLLEAEPADHRRDEHAGREQRARAARRPGPPSGPRGRSPTPARARPRRRRAAATSARHQQRRTRSPRASATARGSKRPARDARSGGSVVRVHVQRVLAGRPRVQPAAVDEHLHDAREHGPDHQARRSSPRSPPSPPSGSSGSQPAIES